MTDGKPWVRSKLKLFLSAGLAIGFVLACLYYGRELVEALCLVDFRWLMAGLACYTINYILRAVRLYLLSRRRIRIWPEGLHASCLHGFATYMMPFRVGELTLPLTLQSTTDLSITDSSRMLIQARLLDFQVLGVITILAAILANIVIGWKVRILWFGMGVAMALAPFVMRISVKACSQHKYRWIRRISRFAIGNQFKTSEFVITLAVWIAIASCFYFAVQAIGLYLTPVQVWLLVTLQLPLQIIPIQGFANAGNHESGWVVGLVMLGVPGHAALEIALTTHIILLVYVLALGPTAIIFGRFIHPPNGM